MSFLGFDVVSTLAEETRRPERTVGNATVAALLIVGLLFIVQTYLAALAHPDYGTLNPELAFFEIGREAGGPLLYSLLLVVGSVTAGLSVVPAQMAVARMLYAVGRDGLLLGSRFLSRVHPEYKTPLNATVLVGVVTLFVTGLFSTEAVVRLINFGALTAFMALNLSVFVYFFVRKSQRGLKGFINHLLFPLSGLAVIAYVWSGFDLTMFIFGLGWLAAGALVTVFRKGFARKPTGRR